MSRQGTNVSQKAGPSRETSTVSNRPATGTKRKAATPLSPKAVKKPAAPGKPSTVTSPKVQKKTPTATAKTTTSPKVEKKTPAVTAKPTTSPKVDKKMPAVTSKTTNSPKVERSPSMLAPNKLEKIQEKKGKSKINRPKIYVHCFISEVGSINVSHILIIAAAVRFNCKTDFAAKLIWAAFMSILI